MSKSKKSKVNIPSIKDLLLIPDTDLNYQDERLTSEVFKNLILYIFKEDMFKSRPFLRLKSNLSIGVNQTARLYFSYPSYLGKYFLSQINLILNKEKKAFLDKQYSFEFIKFIRKPKSSRSKIKNNINLCLVELEDSIREKIVSLFYYVVNLNNKTILEIPEFTSLSEFKNFLATYDKAYDIHDDLFEVSTTYSVKPLYDSPTKPYQYVYKKILKTNILKVLNKLNAELNVESNYEEDEIQFAINFSSLEKKEVNFFLKNLPDNIVDTYLFNFNYNKQILQKMLVLKERDTLGMYIKKLYLEENVYEFVQSVLEHLFVKYIEDLIFNNSKLDLKSLEKELADKFL